MVLLKKKKKVSSERERYEGEERKKLNFLPRGDGWRPKGREIRRTRKRRREGERNLAMRGSCSGEM